MHERSWTLGQFMLVGSARDGFRRGFRKARHSPPVGLPPDVALAGPMNAPFEHPFRPRGGARARRRDAPPYRRKILFEALEQRLLLSADGASSTIADELAAALLQADAPQPAP